ncbi:MAG: hypothetical protein KA251_00375 [Saprospiraceae bacterium]|nr:hypothetical protein [Candidatus Vicinibacter affinis]MBP6521406.1 hypothetical protein [Saprospiraceae bacterium]MBK7302513.1 hypothetical protein [Candidatus Vicinibacter affinis]MBK7695844.1 hypothetical protein [Candidatus Vicinibacter affinis]MBK7798446.1 hypothetical protein [Candidatus Vicinibacter affinis]
MSKFIILLFAFLNVSGLNAQDKYSKLTLEDGKSTLKNPDIKRQIDENCADLSSKTSWDPDLSTNNSSQCQLYDQYYHFSKDNLNWIDQVTITTEMDPAAKMEVEVVQFYQDGKEVPAKNFLNTQIDKCKGNSANQSLKGCYAYFTELLAKSKNMMDQSMALNESSQTLITQSSNKLESEINELKEKKSLSGVKEAKQKKSNLSSLKLFSENTGILMPQLLKLMKSDYEKIYGVSKTMKKLEKGL